VYGNAAMLKPAANVAVTHSREMANGLLLILFSIGLDIK
jgi:hypothetical protein